VLLVEADGVDCIDVLLKQVFVFFEFFFVGADGVDCIELPRDKANTVIKDCRIV
jgi:hypothetical protein